MNLNEIKNLIPKNGEKYIIVENGKPVLVLMNYEDYKKREAGGISPNPTAPVDSRGKINNELTNELTLEDLPF